jgi:hypothetical protein
VLGKKIDLTSTDKKSDRTHPPLKKNKPSTPNVGHVVVSMRITPELAVNCHGWQQRPWPILPMVGVFVCVSGQSPTYKNFGISLTVVQKAYKPQNPYQKNVVNTMLCMTTTWWHLAKNTAVFSRGV